MQSVSTIAGETVFVFVHVIVFGWRALQNVCLCGRQDDGGDFYDHVISPFEGVPADGSPCHVHGSKCEDHFDFRRLGP
eukprot:SAG11_NODE_16771_length_538_cov_0.938497_1_plen_77_part_10